MGDRKQVGRLAATAHAKVRGALKSLHERPTSDRDTLREAVAKTVERSILATGGLSINATVEECTSRILALIPLSEVEEVLGRLVIGYGRDHTSKFCRDQALALLSKLKAIRGEVSDA